MSDSGETIVLQVAYTEDDLREFFKTHAKKQVGMLRWIILGLAIAAALLIVRAIALVATVVMSASGGTTPVVQAVQPLSDVLISIAPYVGGAVLLFIVLRLLQRRLYSKVIRERNPLQRHHVIHLTPAGLIDTEPLSRHEYDWSAFNRWTETQNLILLYLAANIAVLLPKRAFASPEQAARCRELLRSMIDTPRSARQAFEVLPPVSATLLPPPPLPDRSTTS